jgi:hypothetical protein
LLQSDIDSGLENIARSQDDLEKMLSEYEVKFSEPVLDSTRPLDKEREKKYILLFYLIFYDLSR